MDEFLAMELAQQKQEVDLVNFGCILFDYLEFHFRLLVDVLDYDVVDEVELHNCALVEIVVVEAIYSLIVVVAAVVVVVARFVDRTAVGNFQSVEYLKDKKTGVPGVP